MTPKAARVGAGSMGYMIVAKFADKRPNEFAGEFAGLQEAAAFAFELANNLGMEARKGQASDSPSSVAVYSDDHLEIEIAVTAGGLASGPESRRSATR